jgi:hypothetical protein
VIAATVTFGAVTSVQSVSREAASGQRRYSNPFRKLRRICDGGGHRDGNRFPNPMRRAGKNDGFNATVTLKVGVRKVLGSGRDLTFYLDLVDTGVMSQHSPSMMWLTSVRRHLRCSIQSHSRHLSTKCCLRKKSTVSDAMMGKLRHLQS